MSKQAALAELRKQEGTEVHASDWMTVTQERIDAFAEATNDRQWIHVDVARAERESRFGTTIAHGYLTLALFSFLRDVDNAFPGATNIINYGLDKLRFLSAVKVNSRIRGRSELLSVQDLKGSLQVTELFTVDIDGESRPACVAEIVIRVYF